MRQGKYVEDLFERVKSVPDDQGISPAELLKLANETADDHPLWYERFRIRVKVSGAWRWVISKICSGI